MSAGDLVVEFEAAAEASTRGVDAAGWLMSFRKHPAALDVTMRVLQTSNSQASQMQASFVIRDVLLQSWEVLTPEQRTLSGKLLEFLMMSYAR